MGLLQCKILSHNVIMCIVGLKPMSWLNRVCWLRDYLLPKSASNFGTEAAFPKFFALTEDTTRIKSGPDSEDVNGVGALTFVFF